MFITEEIERYIYQNLADRNLSDYLSTKDTKEKITLFGSGLQSNWLISSTQFGMKNTHYDVEDSAFNLTAESGTVVPVAVRPRFFGSSAFRAGKIVKWGTAFL